MLLLLPLNAEVPSTDSTIGIWPGMWCSLCPSCVVRSWSCHAQSPQLHSSWTGKSHPSTVGPCRPSVIARAAQQAHIVGHRRGLQGAAAGWIPLCVALRGSACRTGRPAHMHAQVSESPALPEAFLVLGGRTSWPCVACEAAQLAGPAAPQLSQGACQPRWAPLAPSEPASAGWQPAWP